MKKAFVILIFTLSLWPLYAVNYNIQNLTNSDGLSNSSINTIFQDSVGQMWFGTWDGLNVYNGKEFEVFKPETGNPHSISNNIIRDIIEQKKGIVWIATDLGINRFDTETKSFQRYFFESKNWGITNEHAFLISKNKNNIIFAGVYQQGIFYFDEAAQRFVRLDFPECAHAKKIFFDSNNNLWFLTDEKQFYEISFKNNDLRQPFFNKNLDINSLTNIESVFYDKQNNTIWLQTDDKKYGFYNILTKNFTVIHNFAFYGIIRDVIFKTNGQYLGTDRGLYFFDTQTNSLKQILNDISILSVYSGTQNIIWIGTDMQGVWQLSPSQEKFVTYPNENKNLFNHSAVRTFFEDKEHHLWVGTKGSGIYVFSKDKKTTKLKVVEHYSIQNGLLSNSVFTFANGMHNEIWIGTDGRGINYYDKKRQKIFTLNTSELSHDASNLSSIYAILPDKDNILWVGTSGNGMYQLKIDATTTPYSVKSFRQYTYRDNQTSLSNNIVYAIIKDNNSYLWIATRGGGVNRFNTQAETFQAIHFSTGSDDILCLYKDSKGFLWAGTSMGLQKLVDFGKNNQPKFIDFSEKKGIPNNTIHGILEDSLHHIWVSTNKGIAKVIQDSNKYRIVSYYKKDGLQSNEFSDGAAYQSPYSKLFYFGGIEGFNVFNPLEITHDSYMPNLVLDAFYVDNEETNLVEHLDKKKGQKKLVLSFKNKSFSFRFVPIDYISSGKCEIEYYLKGYQKDWIQLGTSNTIVFSNIPHGNYTLNVRCSNADKIWSDDIYSLKIRILPPWYQTGYAIVSYFILFMLILWGVLRFLKYRIDVKKSIRQKEMEKQKMAEIQEEKLRFFTNIAHEFSNSLTLIYGPSERLLRKGETDPFTKKYLNIIKSNSERMQTLIQQLIDFRKSENGHLKINIEPIDIVELIKFEADNFLIVLEQKHIHFKMQFEPEKMIWNTDRDSLEKIIFNLISNAVKYTPDGETIEVLANASENQLTIKVTNTGIGIKKQYQESIFDRFEVLNRFEKELSKGLETSNGIGLALCKNMTELLHGNIHIESDEKTFTSFIVQLPKQQPNQQQLETFQPVLKAEIAAEQSAVESTPTKSLQTKKTTKNKKNGIALVVDDEQEICSFINDILNEKFDVEIAYNGKEALEHISKHAPTIVICDVIMPVMNGIELVKHIKDSDQTRHIPVILLSSKSTVENQIEGLEIGADGYLGKPFHPRHLEAMIDSLLHRDKAIMEYSDSPYSAVSQFEGNMIKKEDKNLITTITEVIYNNIDNENLSIDLIAAETALSKMQLYRKIKELLEMTPTEYIRAIRLKQAEKLLKTTNKTVQEIMFECGFNNKAYFYREFSKKYHLTPKEYRNQQ